MEMWARTEWSRYKPQHTEIIVLQTADKTLEKDHPAAPHWKKKTDDTRKKLIAVLHEIASSPGSKFMSV